MTACGGHLEIPEPSLQPRAGTVLTPAEPAVIVLPISISLGKIRSAMSAQFPARDSLTQAQCVSLGGTICHQYVYRRDSLELRMNGDRVDLLARLQYRGRVAIPAVGGLASCGYAPENMKRAELHAGTALYWRNDWRLASRNTSMSADLPDKCEVTLLKVDATPLMKRIIDGQLEKLRQQLDSAIPALADLRPSADSLWRTMLQPIALDSASTVWLSLTPDNVALARPLGRSDALTTAVVITAHPRASIGSRPSAERRPLPTLGLAPVQASGIHIPVDIELPFADVSARATQIMKGEVPGADLTVDDVKIWGVGDTAVVKVAVHGTINGDLFMLGRVQYDTTVRQVLVTELKYTLASDSRMSRFKASLGSFRIKRALDQATGHGKLDVGTQLDSLRSQLTAQLNRPLAPGVAVSGAVNTIRISGLATSNTAFVLRVVLDGQARLSIQ
ncbi:MAG: hypothetical protein JWM95_5411 [Gemmatimonadetes bacterium]|nr:hypothetical protein [Gemmatimonadota bacterium]